MTPKKKLIEVALPLEAINIASVRESYIYRGNPSALHKWWAQRPLAAGRAVLFAQMVDAPSAYLGVLRADAKLHRKAESALKARLKLWEEARALSNKVKGSGLSVPEPGPAPTLDDMLADDERQRLFRIIEKLVLWENTTNETVLQAARDEIWQSWRRACAENAEHPRAKELFDRHKLPGSTVTVTLEIEAEIPAGAPDTVVRTVTENSRTLKFSQQGVVGYFEIRPSMCDPKPILCVVLVGTGTKSTARHAATRTSARGSGPSKIDLGSREANGVNASKRVLSWAHTA